MTAKSEELPEVRSSGVPVNGTSLLLEWLLVAIAFLGVNILSSFLQPPLTFLAGRGWELGTYFDVASKIRDGVALSGSAPAVFRIGVPWIVAHLPVSDLSRGFFYVNLVASALTASLLVLLLRHFLSSWKIRVAILVFYFIHWLGPTRFIYYTSGGVDAPGLLFLLAGLLLIERFRRGHRGLLDLAMLSMVVIVGVTIRETTLAIPIVFAFVAIDRREPFGRDSLVALIPLFLGGVAFALVRTSVTQVDHYNFLGAALNWFYSKPLPTYILGWFITFGPVLVLPMISLKIVKRFATEQTHLLIYIILFTLLAYIGGSDTERILFWSMPAMLVLFGMWFEHTERSVGMRVFIGVVLLLQLISERAFWNTPDLNYTVERSRIFLTSLSSTAYYLNLFSFHAPRAVSALMLIEYAVVTLALLIWGLALKSRQHSR